MRGLRSIAAWIMGSGLSPDDAASVMWVSVNAACPNDLPQINLILDKLNGKTTEA
jgi:hypothetical protein